MTDSADVTRHFVLTRLRGGNRAIEIRSLELSGPPEVLGPAVARQASEMGFVMVFEFDRKPDQSALLRAARHEHGDSISSLPGMLRLWVLSPDGS